MYIDQLLGVACTQKLIKVLLFNLNLFLLIQMFFSDFLSKNKKYAGTGAPSSNTVDGRSCDPILLVIT